MEATCEGAKRADLWLADGGVPHAKWISSVMEMLESRKVDFRAVSLRKFVLGIVNGKAVLFVDGERMEKDDLPKVAFIHMPNATWSVTLLTAIRHLEAVGVRCVNSSKAFSITINKYEQMRVLTGVDVKMADTLTYPTNLTEGMLNMLQIPNAIAFPAILKHVHGTRGKRVILLESGELAEDLAEVLYDDGMYLLQDYISESRAIHYRVMVAGSRVLGYFKYDNTASSRVQSNLFQGGLREEIEGSKELEELSLRISTALGTDIAGIDYLKDKDGYFVFLEANGSAGVSNHTGIMNGVIDYLLECCLEAKMKEEQLKS